MSPHLPTYEADNSHTAKDDRDMATNGNQLKETEINNSLSVQISPFLDIINSIAHWGHLAKEKTKHKSPAWKLTYPFHPICCQFLILPFLRMCMFAFLPPSFIHLDRNNTFPTLFQIKFSLLVS